MNKRLQITPEITAHLSRALGGPVDPARYAVYEALSANTLPLRRRGGLYDKAQLSLELLAGVALYLQSHTAPVHVMHESYTLNVGKVFYGELRGDELWTLFFVSLSEEDILAKIDDGTVDEVSLSILPKTLKCSKCGFDFMSPEATWENTLTATCDEGHVMGQDGAYAIVGALDQFNEMSIVSRGAVDGTKIVTQEKSYRLAASVRGTPSPFILRLHAESNTMPGPAPGDTNGGGNPSVVTANLSEIIALTTKSAQTEAALSAATTENTTLKAKVTDLEAQLAVYKAKDADLTAAEASKASLAQATAFLTDSFKSVSAALGNLTPEVPTELDKLIAGLKAAGPNLASIYAPGGRANPAVSDSSKAQSSSLAGFRDPSQH